MKDVCVSCNKQFAAENCHLCEACLDYQVMQEEENQNYLAELAEYRSQYSNEEWEAMTSLDIDDIPF